MSASISQRALAASNPPGVTDMPEKERPLSEQYRLAGDAWVAAKKKRDLIRGLKDTMLERRKREIIDDAHQAGERMSKADAEGFVKASTEWENYIRGLVDADEATEAAWVKVHEIELRYGEWQSAEANARKERQMGRQAT